MKRSLLAMIAVSLCCAPGARAQATVYVPNLDRAYADIDALIAAGWIHDAISSQTPFSRLTAARLTVQARARAGSSPAALPARFVESLRRLEIEFAPEIRTLCTDVGCARDDLPAGLTLRAASADATYADSPTRAVPTSYDDARYSYIDADLNPLLQKNQGRVLHDGGTIGGEAVVDVRASHWLVGQLHPRAWVGAPRAGSANVNLSAYDAYARALAGNIALELGRNHIALGYGPESGPLLSNNARGYDLVRLSLDHPVHFPVLGRFTTSLMIADMGGNSDTPHSKLTLLDFAIRPIQYFEFGASLLNHQGGRNSPPATLTERVKDLLLINKYEPGISDKVFAARARITVPALRTQFSAQMATTDDHDWFRQYYLALRDEATWIADLRVIGIGPDGRLDLWAEARRAGMRPSTHHQFTSGLTLDRRMIGDAIGPVGESVTGGVAWRGSRHTWGVSATAEQYGGADVFGDAPYFFLKIDRADEVRVRMTADWSSDPLPGRLTTSLHAGYEHVDHYDFHPVVRSNFMLQMKMEYKW